MNGIIIVDKPKDFTSFDVVAVVRKILHEKKVGHSGTLDPMATGVLPVLIGKATKTQELLPDTDKEYHAHFKLGITTDTLDITGKVLSECKSSISKADIENILPEFRGDIMQIPPMYSALSRDGVRLYELARKGIEVERYERRVTISELILDEFDEKEQSGIITVKCSKGTYIRSICDDIGKKLGCGCIMTDLRRTLACGYDISESFSLDEIKKLAEENRISEIIKSIDSIFNCFDEIHVTEKQTFRFKNGGGLMLSRIYGIANPDNGKLYRVYGNNNDFLGLGIVDIEKEELSVKKILLD